VWGKGKAAVMGVECAVTVENGPLYTTHAALFVRSGKYLKGRL